MTTARDTDELPADAGQSGEPESSHAVRVVVYVPSELHEGLDRIRAEKGYAAVKDIVQQGIRMVLLSNKHESDPDRGLYWKEGETFSKVYLM